jgi:glucan phosphoethanolaminetransferase (alkaline phosphatase superfamily)
MFIVLHHTGSHYKYSQRYPPQFDRFQPSLPKNAGYNAITKDNKELLVNAYDNTILYTDYCLFSVINRLKQTGCAAALVYMSDHGENLYDDDNNLVLHCSYLGSRFEFNVPFIVWYSDRYKQLYPQKTALLTSNSRKLINSDVLFHSLLDMADVPSLYLDSSLSVFSAAYKEPDSVACYTASGKQIFFKKQP